MMCILLVSHVSESKDLFSLEPCAELISLQFKFRPCKDALCTFGLQALKLHPVSCMSAYLDDAADPAVVRSLCRDARAQWLHNVLKQVVKYVAKTRYSALYPENCNRFRERESGFINVVKAYGFITKSAGGAPVYFNQKHALAKEGTIGKWFVQDGSVAKIKQTMEAWDEAVAKARGCDVSSAPVYLQVLRSMVDVLESHKAPRLSRGYLLQWSVRSFLNSRLYAMGRWGVSDLNKLSINDFIHVQGPDQCQNVRNICAYFKFRAERGQIRRPTTVKQFLAAFDLDSTKVYGQLFSMWLCFAADCGWAQENFDAWDEKKCYASTPACARSLEWRHCCC